jgi:hypothetical protein
LRISKAAALFVALLVASLVATGVVVHSRTPELVLEVRRLPEKISPDGDGERDVARIRFFVRETDPHARVEIVGRDLAQIRTLDADAALEADDSVTYVWDGTTDAGAKAPVGRYRLRVVLPDHDRDMVFPKRIDLVG